MTLECPTQQQPQQPGLSLWTLLWPQLSEKAAVILSPPTSQAPVYVGL